MSGLPDTYLKGDSYKSEIRIFSPFAIFSMVSIFGMEPLQISDIVDLGTPVRIDTCRTVNFLFDMIFCSRISIIKNYIPVSIIKILVSVGRSGNMGLRFRKSFKVAPGVKVNIGKKSSSVSFGGKGARYTVSSSGRRTKSVSIPGTGISYVDTKTPGSGNKKSASKSSAGARPISTGSGASPSPKRDKKPEMPDKEKHASVLRMILFYLFTALFAFSLLIGLLLIIGSISEGVAGILMALFWNASSVCGVISTWKLAKRERYLLKHDEPYRNETPKLIIGVAVFTVAMFISASFIPDYPETEQASMEEEVAEVEEEEPNKEPSEENEEVKKEIPDETEEDQEQIVDNQSDQEESEVPVSEEPVQEEPIQEEPVQEEVVQEDPAPQQEITVYITNTGSKYHRDTCRTLKNSKIPISLSEAISSYEPCGICNPPTN